MKVLVFPNRPPNPYFEEFNRSLRSTGIETTRLANVLRLRSDFNVMHFHFPDQVITQGSLIKSIAVTFIVLCLILYARVTRRPIVWMVHDVNSLWLRRKRLLSVFMKIFKSCVNGYIFLSEYSQKEFYDNSPGEEHKSSILVSITRYRNYAFDKTELDLLREKNNIGKGEILISILGDIKPHKGSRCIPLIPNQTSNGVKVNLAVCGLADSMKEDSIEALLQERPNNNYVRINKRLEDDELALWIQSSDAVLLPYDLGSNSSMAINVLSNHSRIISSDIPMFRELSNRFGESWIKTVDVGDKNMIEKSINGIPSWKSQPLDFERLEEALREGDPDQTGKRLFKFYNELCLSLQETKSSSKARA